MPLAKIPIQMGASLKLKTVTAKDNSLTLQIIKDDNFFYLHSAYNPQVQARNQAESIDLEDDSVVICFGLGFGYHATAILERFSNNNRLLIIEPSKEIFLKACEHKLLLHLDNLNSVSTCVTDNFFKLTSFFQQNLSEFDTNKIKLFIHPTYRKLFEKECEIFLSALKDVLLTKQVNLTTIVNRGKLWQKCTLENIPFIFDSYYFNILKDEFKNLPIIIVAGGPSLNKNVHFLKQIKNKILIICMYTAYKALKSHNIEPDFIIAYDSLQTRFESETDLQTKIKTPLIYQAFLDTKLLKKHDGQKIFATDMTESFVPKLLNKVKSDLDFITIGGSVACACLSIAKYLGTNQIILIGQDLAFDGDLTHASGTYYDGISTQTISGKDVALCPTIEDIYGNKIKTMETYLTFKLWIEQFINDNKDKIEFIDATEGGALIKGTKISTLLDAFEYYMSSQNANSINIDKKLTKLFDKPKFLSSIQKEKILSNLNIIFNDIFNLLPIIREGITICKRLEEKFSNATAHTDETAKSLKRLDEIDAKIQSHNDSLTLFDFTYVEMALDIKSIKDDKLLNAELNIIKQSLALYEGIESLIIDLEPSFEYLKANLL